MSDSTATAPGNDLGEKILPFGGTAEPRPSRTDATEDTADADWGEKARREAAHIEFDCCFHTKAQFEACAEWEKWNVRLGMVTALLGAVTVTAIVSALGDVGMTPPVPPVPAGSPPANVASQMSDWSTWGKLALAFVALVAGAITATMKFLDPKGRAAQHGAAGKRYRALADEARQFRNLMVTANAKRENLLASLAAMIKRRAEIHEAAPVLPERAMTTMQAKAASGQDTCLKRLAGEAKLPTG